MGMSKYDELVTQVLNYLDNRDWDSAYSLLKNKELQGDAAAIAVLGEFYINGIGIPEDVEMGIEMLKRAIDAGCAEATGTLATLYLQGEKVPTNERLAINYIKQGADMGNSVAMGKMASVYLYGSYGVQDKKKTFDIIRRRGHKVNMQEKPGMVSESYPSLYEARKSEKTADKK